MKKIYLFGNWKMNMSVAAVEQFAGQMREALERQPGLRGETEFCVFPPFVLIPAAAGALKAVCGVGAQNVSEYDAGAYTGEVSAAMLREQGVKYAVVGHSERRHIYGESSRQVNLKVLKAVESGLVPVMCVGETLEEREAGRTLEVVGGQLATGIENLPRSAEYLIAYEPVWAIGTGRAAKPSDAEEVCSFIKSRADVPVLYGGSVKPSNAAEIFSQPSVDGGLIGGASLKADEFLEILKNYRDSE